jgi:hypothetical protein
MEKQRTAKNWVGIGVYNLRAISAFNFEMDPIEVTMVPRSIV